MEESPASSRPLSELSARCDSAYADWQAVSRDPRCWSDPEIRRAMLDARIAYQDALAEYVTALRSAQSLDAYPPVLPPDPSEIR